MAVEATLRQALAMQQVTSAAGLDRVSRLLANAFHDEELVSWMLRADGNKARAMGLFHSILVKRMVAPIGEVWLDREALSAALWLPAGHRQPGLGAWEQLPMLRDVIRACGWSRVLRPHRAGARLARFLPAEPHCYLMSLGVELEARGQGRGSALLAHGLERCDVAHQPAFLQTATRRNVKLYQRHGFRVVDESAAPSMPRTWFMWREAR